MTLLRWLLDPPTWFLLAVGVVVWVVVAGLVIRWVEADSRKRDLGPIDGADWFIALFAGLIAGAIWWVLLVFVLPAAIGIWLVWRAATLVAHPPRRRRLPPPTVHWTDALPADTPMERVVELAERKATERQRPDPSRRELR